MPLSQQRRTQLDGIVKSMGDQNAPQADVQLIVKDFLGKYGNEASSPGGFGSMSLSNNFQATTQPVSHPMPGLVRDVTTPFAKLGVGAYNAITGTEGQSRNLPGFGNTTPYPSIIKPGGIFTPPGQKFGLQQPINPSGLGQAVEAGVSIGTTIGAPGAAKPAAELVEKGIGMAGQKLEERAAEKATKTALEAITRKATDIPPKEYQSLLKRGLVEAKKVGQPEVVKLTEREVGLANKYKDLLQSKDGVKNTENLMNEIIKHDSEVGKYLDSKKIIYNTGELRNSLLESIKGATDVLAPSQTVVEKAKADLVDKFVSQLKTNDLKDLWRVRKEFDQWAKVNLNAFSGSPTLKKEIATGIRNSAQQFITDHLGNEVYAGHMKQMTELFDLVKTVGQKSTKVRGLDILSEWAKNNPKTYGALKWGLYITGTERVLKSVGAPVP